MVFKYDEFTKLKKKDMSKVISDMTYEYIQPETQKPTVVPATHYEKQLGQVIETEVAVEVRNQMLSVIYNQLVALKKENEEFYNQAILCMDVGLNPKDLRIPEQAAIKYTYDFMKEKEANEKKDYHFLNQEIVDMYNESLTNPEIQKDMINLSNRIKDLGNINLKSKSSFDREER